MDLLNKNEQTQVCEHNESEQEKKNGKWNTTAKNVSKPQNSTYFSHKMMNYFEKKNASYFITSTRNCLITLDDGMITE